MADLESLQDGFFPLALSRPREITEGGAGCENPFSTACQVRYDALRAKQPISQSQLPNLHCPTPIGVRHAGSKVRTYGQGVSHL